MDFDLDNRSFISWRYDLATAFDHCCGIVDCDDLASFDGNVVSHRKSCSA
jgi:hypothetical protein